MTRGEAVAVRVGLFGGRGSRYIVPMKDTPQLGDIRSFRTTDGTHDPRTLLARSSVLGFEELVLAGTALTCDADDAVESAYVVLRGAVELIGPGNEVVSALGPLEGVHVPREAPCRLTPSAGDTTLLSITALDPRPASERRAALRAPLRTFRYDSPDLGDKLIKVPYLVEQKDMLGLSVEKVRDGGGDDPFHTHSGTDSVWYVLSGGRARFRRPDGSEIVVGPGGGVYIPRMAAYGFAALDHEPSEVLHVKVRDLSVSNERLDY